MEKKSDSNKEKNPKKDAKKYFYAVGRRKTSVARVKLHPEARESAGIMVNGKKMEEFFPSEKAQTAVLAPLKAVEKGDAFGAEISVSGGGKTGQSEATRLAVAKALVIFNGEFKKSLRDLGFLTRDSRKVERKKAGLKKARRAPQWAKR